MSSYFWLGSSSWNMSVMNYEKILNNYACSKLDQATLLWLLECIFKAGLEQEIESLKKKLATCTRENLNLQEELSEAYKIKSHLADLHSAEASKNMEAEKQLKFFQGCVAAAFAERDNAIMEAEKAKEKEETMSQLISGIQKRVEDLTADCLKLKTRNDTLQTDLAKQIELNENFKMVVNKFLEIKLQSLEEFENTSWDDKCACLLDDPKEVWSFNDTSTSKYISALEEELETLRNSVDNLRSKLRVGLEIENHLKKRINFLEKKQISMDKMIRKGIADLKHYHSQYRNHVINLLDDGESNIKSIINMIDERVRRFDQSGLPNLIPQREAELEDSEYRDVHISPQAQLDSESKMSCPSLLDVEGSGKVDASEALAQALREKVAALLLLSQQEERHLLERNVNSALQRRIEELKRNLLQVTNEKVKALLELAQLKQEHRSLLEKLGPEARQGKALVDTGEGKIVTQERDWRFRNLLKKTYLKRWVGPVDVSGNEVGSDPNNEGKLFSRRSNSFDFARMKIELATLKESMESIEHLTTSIHRLRLSLLQAKESMTFEGTVAGGSMLEVLDDIISEAKLVKTALSSSLPINWSAEADLDSIGGSACNDPGDAYPESTDEKIDSVSAAGFEMVELLIFAAQMLKDNAKEDDS